MLPDEVRKAVEVDPADLLIEVWPPDPGGMRAYMPRGVRVTHKPTGITATCDDQRSQHANRDEALRRITAHLSENSREV